MSGAAGAQATSGTATGGPVVTIRGLRHRYGSHVALDGVDLQLTAGVTGLLGPNGAGKTTLLSVLATALRPTAGSVTVGDADLGTAAGRRSARRLIGHLPQRFDLMDSATVLRNVAYAAWAQGVPAREANDAAARALEAVGLLDRAPDRAGRLSGGQRQRLGIACALTSDPAVLLLDEPTVGLDPAQRASVRGHLKTLGENRVVLLSTHLVEDLAMVADRLLVLSAGRIAFDGPVAALEDLAPAEQGGMMSRLEGGYLQALERVPA